MSKTWPDTRLLELLGIELPIVQAPMAGPTLHEMVIAVSEAGGLGSLPCALLTPQAQRRELDLIRAATARPINLNFFCHQNPAPDAAREAAWRERLRPYYLELGLDPAMPLPATGRNPFDAAACELVEQYRPAVVSFHFGLPAPELLARVRASGARVIASATTVAEARWLRERGVDAIIAQGAEAGGHRGVFLHSEVYSQPGLFALLPQVVDVAGDIPVIASGGIADARGIAAAFALGAAGVQIGTAYLHTPEAHLPAPHRAALHSDAAETTALTNLFTGRPARGIVNRLMREVGPLSELAPAFPLAGGALAPLRAASEPGGSGDFMPLWAGQAAPLSPRGLGAGELTRQLAAQALQRLQTLA
ncbi:MAG: NAD(P)H-dependent flavin oxidoreductase [Roseateles asaccharophilus]|uniref:Nitronate monooxygenase n=1 Tax=Roseateles asaccharophilus TaxID=582607 RepID=A0A4V3CKC5_9BURK|nr:nitronate monooxygenase family protein [Roseateles asaccharophilus]MDN3542904.1 nitronate monooxygenase family protein [Roseateles asaccharophilus]TDP13397.1 nitronate monooxygenase [Roseateles asaccharophilus]